MATVDPDKVRRVFLGLKQGQDSAIRNQKHTKIMITLTCQRYVNELIFIFGHKNPFHFRHTCFGTKHGSQMAIQTVIMPTNNNNNDK